MGMNDTPSGERVHMDFSEEEMQANPVWLMP